MNPKNNGFETRTAVNECNKKDFWSFDNNHVSEPTLHVDLNCFNHPPPQNAQHYILTLLTTGAQCCAQKPPTEKCGIYLL